MSEAAAATFTPADLALTGPAEQEVTGEIAVVQRMLDLNGARILELGCGAAEKTRLIAEKTGAAEIVAVEIDPIAHQKNLQITDLPRVRFKSYGAEDIAEDAAQFDVVMMFKSLHHVPGNRMDTALEEIARVLKPGGHAYISEPVFAGEFNDIMRLFHDEEAVRRDAFNALKRCVERGHLQLKEEYFFNNRIRLQSWEQYQHGILNVSHTDHQLTDELLAAVRTKFLAAESEQGFAFDIPNRVDLLYKPA